MKNYYVYILASQKNGTIYIGVTSNIIKRVYEHKEKQAIGFTKKYGVSQLVYYEIFNSIEEAIKREKRLKNWHRSWKRNLINEKNPKWEDLYEGIL